MALRKVVGQMRFDRATASIHLIAVFTDEGLTGWGSAFTNDQLVQAALSVLDPALCG